MITSLFITGANGFIGRHLLARLDRQKFANVYCLSRRPQQSVRETTFHWLVGSIFDSAVYGETLDSVDAVIHLAATTGKAPRDQYFSINFKGTQYLLDQCKQRGVRNFLYVSSIVARYKDKSYYYYAQSKQKGEDAVIQSGINYAIVRPTIVLGRDAPNWRALSRLAQLPVIPLIGNGDTLIQPVDVDDVADSIISVVKQGEFRNESMDFGGPEVLSIEEFLKRIHRLYNRNQPRIVHLPPKPVRWIVGISEKYLSRLMPLNAGQLSVFVEEGMITVNPLFEASRSRLKDVDAMLKSLVSDEKYN
jgi:NADH dehydrogenase